MAIRFLDLARRRSIRITWLVSYICVWLVPVLISGIVYSVAYRMIQEEINRSNQSALIQIRQEVDSRLSEIDTINTEITLNSSVAKFKEVKQPLGANDSYELYGISNLLKSFSIPNNFIEKLYIYYKNSDVVVSNNRVMSSHDLYNIVRQSQGISYEDWKQYFNKRFILDDIPVLNYDHLSNPPDGTPTQAVMFARSVALDDPQMGAIVLSVVDTSNLLNQLSNVSAVNHSNIMILDSSNRIIASTSPNKQLVSFPYNTFSNSDGIMFTTVGGTQFALSYTTSAITGWKYVAVTPVQIFNEKMQYLRALTYADILICFLIGVAMTYFFLRKNYNPIGTLIETLSMKSGTAYPSDSNEYAFINEVLNSTFAEKEEINLRLAQYNSTLRLNFLMRLLKGNVESSIPVHESLVAHDIEFASSHFAVILFNVESLGKLEAADELQSIEKNRLVHFIVANVVEEVASQLFNAYMVEVEDMVAFIVNLRNPSSEGGESLQDLLGIVQRSKLLLEEKIGIHLTVAISEINDDIYGISQGYQQALEAMEYRLVMGSGEIITYMNIQEENKDQMSSRYYYPLNVEQQLINCVKAGNFTEAQVILDQIVKFNLTSSSLTVDMAKCLMFNFVSTIMKTIDEIKNAHKEELILQDLAIERLFNCTTIKEMQEQITDVLRQVCDAIRLKRESINNRLSIEVLQYVREHFADLNMNITKISEFLGMTPAYVSKQFKEQTGEALLDHINKVRMEKAKQLLINSHQPINEIARLAGYSDINTFNRTFKKYEGVTPGKYREFVNA